MSAVAGLLAVDRRSQHHRHGVGRLCGAARDRRWRDHRSGAGVRIRNAGLWRQCCAARRGGVVAGNHHSHRIDECAGALPAWGGGSRCAEAVGAVRSGRHAGRRADGRAVQRQYAAHRVRGDGAVHRAQHRNAVPATADGASARVTGDAPDRGKCRRLYLGADGRRRGLAERADDGGVRRDHAQGGGHWRGDRGVHRRRRDDRLHHFGLGRRGPAAAQPRLRQPRGVRAGGRLCRR